jgi:hypothetical protein
MNRRQDSRHEIDVAPRRIDDAHGDGLDPETTRGAYASGRVHQALPTLLCCRCKRDLAGL